MAIINQKPGNYPKENLLYSVHGGSLKSKSCTFLKDLIAYASYHGPRVKGMHNVTRIIYIYIYIYTHTHTHTYTFI